MSDKIQQEMAITFHPAAFRHRVSQDRSLYVITYCRSPIQPPDPDDPDEADLVLFLGPDEHGVPLEVIAIEQADGNLLVIHAMRLRRKYAAAYVEVVR